MEVKAFVADNKSLWVFHRFLHLLFGGTAGVGAPVVTPVYQKQENGSFQVNFFDDLNIWMESYLSLLPTWFFLTLVTVVGLLFYLCTRKQALLLSNIHSLYFIFLLPDFNFSASFNLRF